jgi:23S rRNA G2445 N2-methylase RlmL
LAAIMLMLARYDPRRDVLIDPLAGSGTLAIEAACMAQALPIWVPPRRPAIADMPIFTELASASGALFADARPRVFASDVSAAQANELERAAHAAGVADYVRVRCADFRDLSPASLPAAAAGPGLIISNPPYGERMQRDDLLDLYADLGAFCARFRGYRAAFLVANPGFARAFGWRPRIQKPLSNGPLRGYFYLYEIDDAPSARHAHRSSQR